MLGFFGGRTARLGRPNANGRGGTDRGRALGFVGFGVDELAYELAISEAGTGIVSLEGVSAGRTSQAVEERMVLMERRGIEG